MPYTLTFNTFSEKKPNNEEEVFFLKRVSSFDSYGYDLTAGTIEFCWFEYDSNDNITGNQITYEDGDEEPETYEGYYYKLHIMLDGHVVDGVEDDYLWISIDDFYRSLPIN